MVFNFWIIKYEAGRPLEYILIYNFTNIYDIIFSVCMLFAFQ
jgi:hypothetical protein